MYSNFQKQSVSYEENRFKDNSYIFHLSDKKNCSLKKIVQRKLCQISNQPLTRMIVFPPLT